jgi:hypothetical protein
MDPWCCHLDVQLQPAGSWCQRNYKIRRILECLVDLEPHEDQGDLKEENHACNQLKI